MSTKVTEVSLSFQDVKYTVPTTSGPRTLLNDVSGIVNAGQCCAILGSSGSGKTTLLDILSGVIPRRTKDLNGTILFNGLDIPDNVRTLLCSYVMQDDRLLANLTVRETFWYAAQLRLSSQMSFAEKNRRVDEVISELGLRKVTDCRIGGTFTRGISGGERRRISIGVQLLANPSIIFLDEPTTGLDAFTANNVANTLVNLAKEQRKTVIFTIHQPRSDIFPLLDLVMLLSQGQSCYFGPASEIVPHFTRLGFPCDIYTNPLDHYIDITSVDKRTDKQEEETSARLEELVQSYTKSAAFHAISEGIRQQEPVFINIDNNQSRTAKGIISFLFIFFVLLSRQWTDLRRDLAALFARIGQLTTVGWLLFLFLGKLDFNQSSVQNRTGLLYQAVVCTAVLGLLNAVSLFPAHRDLFYRERQERLYSSGTFLLAYLAHHLPVSILSSGLFSVVCYFLIGLNQESVERFFVFWGVCLILHLWGEIFSNALLCIFYNVNTANSTTALIISIATLMATGFVRSFPSMPLFLQEIGYATIQKYASEIVVVNEFSDLDLRCDPGEKCFYPSGEVYLFIQYPDAADHELLNWLMLGAYVIATFLACWALLFFNRQRLR